MYFHIGQKLTLLFKGWSVNDTKELSFYLVVIFTLAALYECLRGLQKVFMFKTRMPERRPIRSQQEKDAVLRKRLVMHIVATLLYIVQVCFGYMLMLLVMTYNYIILISTILGVTIGFYLSEPLIVKGIEALYIARIQRRFPGDQSACLNGNGEHLLNETVGESSL